MSKFGDVQDYAAERRTIIEFAKSLRSTKENHQSEWQEAAEWHMKYSCLNGRKSLALTITLSPVGCQCLDRVVLSATPPGTLAPTNPS